MKALIRTAHAQVDRGGEVRPVGSRAVRAVTRRRSAPRVLILTVGFTVGGAEQLILMTAPRLRQAGFENITVVKDYGGLDRVIVGELTG